MTPQQMATEALAAMHAGSRMTLTRQRGVKMPPKFPRGELLCENFDGRNVYSYEPAKVIAWLNANRLVAVEIVTPDWAERYVQPRLSVLQHIEALEVPEAPAGARPQAHRPRCQTGELKMKNTKWVAALIAGLGLTGCTTDASVASHNISKAADNFEISRRIVFYNGITGEYMLSIEGLCSLGSASETKAVTVTCKTGPGEYKKHFLGLSHNVTYFAEQVAAAHASQYQYRVVFKPLAIVPDIEIRK